MSDELLQPVARENVRIPTRLHTNFSSQPAIHSYSDGKGHLLRTSRFQKGGTFRRGAPHRHFPNPSTGEHSSRKVRGDFSVWGDYDGHHMARVTSSILRRRRKESAGYIWGGHNHMRPRYRVNGKRYGKNVEYESFDE